jgi:Pyruvate/2-oxoacid:ferredoxin oxidoreductase delta subunit
VGHLGHVKQEYRELVTRLEHAYMPFPAPESERAVRGYQEILEILYTPEDAALAARLPQLPTTLEQLSRRLGMEAETLRPRLETMCERGIVMDLVSPKDGSVRYMLAPPLGGFVEFAMMRAHDHIPKKQLAHALEAYLLGDDTFAREIFSHPTPIGRAVVHESAPGTDTPEVLDWERATALVEESTSRAVSLCYCRHTAAHLGTACDAPMDNCLSLNGGADFVIRRKFGRAIDKAEARDLLVAAREKGLVQIADNVQRHPLYICNCCGCCCEQLLAINRWQLPAVIPSGLTPVVDTDACKGCARCARVCPVKAVTVVPVAMDQKRKNRLEPLFDLDRCIGCGVCADACRNHALRMQRTRGRPDVPKNGYERVVRMALEHGTLGHLLFDDGNSGGRFLGELVAAISRLGPVHRALAHKQVRSRFVRFLTRRR